MMISAFESRIWLLLKSIILPFMSNVISFSLTRIDGPFCKTSCKACFVGESYAGTARVNLPWKQALGFLTFSKVDL